MPLLITWKGKTWGLSLDCTCQSSPVSNKTQKRGSSPWKTGQMWQAQSYSSPSCAGDFYHVAGMVWIWGAASPALSASCRPEFESSLPLHQEVFFPKGFCRGWQLLKVLRKQHEGAGQSSSSRKQEDNGKVFERKLSGGEILEGGLLPSYSVSNKNPGKEKERQKDRKEIQCEGKTWIWLFLSLQLTSRTAA